LDNETKSNRCVCPEEREDRELLVLSPGHWILLALAFWGYDSVCYLLPAPVGTVLAFMLGAAILGLSAVNFVRGLNFFLVVLIFSDDISRMDPMGGAAGAANMLTVSLQGVALSNFLAIALLVIGLLTGLMGHTNRKQAFGWVALDGCVAGILILYLAAVVHGLGWLFSNPRGALNDLNLPLMLCGFYFIVRLHATCIGALVRLWHTIFLAMAAKTLVWAIWLVLGIGVEFGTSLRVSFESGRVLLVFVFLVGLVLQNRSLHLSVRARGTSLIISMTAALNLLMNASRGPWLMSLYGLGCLFAFGRVQDKILWVVVGCFCVVIVAGGLLIFNPSAYETIGHFADTLKVWDPERVASSHSTMVRAYGLLNIHAQLKDDGKLLLGEGPGSLFTDGYRPFPFPLHAGDYRETEILSRKFQNPHGLLANLMLNVGYGGMIVYLGLIFVGYLSLIVAFLRAEGAGALRAMSLALIAFLPAMVYSAWSSKNTMLLGTLLGMAGCLCALLRPGDARLKRTIAP